MKTRQIIVSRKTLEKIEQNASNKTEQIAIKQKEIARNKISYIPHFKDDLKNTPTQSPNTTFGINTAKKISISATDQSADTNRIRTEHL